MENFEYIVQQHAARYPDMQPQDFGKLAYQSEFGPAHLSQNVDELTASLLHEWQPCPRIPPSIRPSRSATACAACTLIRTQMPHLPLLCLPN